ncbi:MAG: class I SAM-dependent methyltransferase [Endomicrobium sp.]|jgi:hypothetical protein|nr:class I SAM-dependent methyltransferase [Endomicrobium sp.]
MKMADAKSYAQKIAFAPLTFEAVRAMLNMGVLKVLDDAGKEGITPAEIESKLNLSHYAVSTLLEAAAGAQIIDHKNGKYFTTKIVRCFLYDQMTKVNMDFVHDVCYQGAFYLEESFKNAKPEGLKVFGNWPTVYEGLSQLPQHVKKSWFAFDHFYSDNAFNDVIKIILEKNPQSVYDIGCNTGKFELALLSKNYKGCLTLCDLPRQLEAAKANLSAAGFVENCIFYPIDVLDKTTQFPQNQQCPPDAVLMSQFLDCFSKEQIIFILKKAAAVMTQKTKLYILEPFWDIQKFEAAKLSLTHTSLYFTAIANGNSKMYAQAEMQECVKAAGFKTVKNWQNIGSHEYTLIEAVKAAAPDYY